MRKARIGVNQDKIPTMINIENTMSKTRFIPLFKFSSNKIFLKEITGI
jgi:hypothetical protein